MWRLVSILFWVTLVYSGYWFAASGALRVGTNKAVSVLASQGLDLSFGEITTTGYPTQFNTVWTDLRLAHPDWSWQGPRLNLQADSYRPLSVGLTFPEEQTIAFAGNMLRVTSENWQVDVEIRPSSMLTFDNGHITMGQTAVESDAGWQLGLGRLVAGLVHSGNSDDSYHADLTAERINLPVILRDQIDPNGTLGPEVSAITGTARVMLAYPPDLQDKLPDVDQVTLHDLRLDWGPVTAEMTGDIAIDTAGQLTGQFTLSTQQWQIMLDVLTEASFLDARVANTITRLAGFMADSDGMLTVPVSFQDGVTLVGLVPVGPAPQLR